MSVLTPPRGDQLMDRVNPVAKLASALLLAGVLVLTVDWVSASVALGCEAVLFLFAGVSLRTFFLRTIPIWIAAPAAGLTTFLYGQASGQEYWSFGLVSVTEGSVELASRRRSASLPSAFPPSCCSSPLTPRTSPTVSDRSCAAPSPFRARRSRRAPAGWPFHRRLEGAWTGQAGTRGRRHGPGSPDVQPGVRPPGAVAASGQQAGDGDGGPRVRRPGRAHVGSDITVRSTRSRFDRTGVARRRTRCDRVRSDRELEFCPRLS